MKTTKEKGFEVNGSGCSEYRHVTVRVVQLSVNCNGRTGA